MKPFIYLLAHSVFLIAVASCQGQKQQTVDASGLISHALELDLSHTVICPDSVPTEVVSDWFVMHEPLGFKGHGHQRFQIHFETVTRQDSLTYLVSGKTRCRGEVLPFEGTIVVDSVNAFDPADNDEYAGCNLSEVGIITAHYELESYEGSVENSKHCKTAEICGNASYGYFIYDGQIYYDALMLVADGYCNNQYEGVWVDAATNDSVVCNWGDFRIPSSGSLDIGCAEFIPSDSAQKYFGWDDFAKFDAWWK